MSAKAVPIGSETTSFVNRDHIVLVTIDQSEIVVTTTLGTKVRLPASAGTLAKFVDELANDVGSNFVSIVSNEQPAMQK